jgi:hypothetical protein
MQEERLREGRAQARKAPLRPVERAVGLDDPRRHRADPRVGVGGRGHPLERRGVERGVRVEQQDVRGGAEARSRIAAVREPTVVRQRDRGQRESGDAREAVVGRRAVDDDDLEPFERGQGLHAFAQVIGAVVGDHDDVDVRHRADGSARTSET